MHTSEEQSPIFITHGREQPPLEYGPQRIHYMYSVGIPQAYLTLFSILQGIVFSLLLVSIPLPHEVTLYEFWTLILQQYFYLPYIISIGIVILIWLHQVSITLTGGWPHSFFQVSLVTLLTLFEICLARTSTVLPLWLFFAGCVGIVGGIVLVRTGKIRRPEDFNSDHSFQKFAFSLIRSEILRGIQYLIMGSVIVTLSIVYYNTASTLKILVPHFHDFSPYVLYVIMLVLLCFLAKTVSRRSKSHQAIREAMYAKTDLITQNGIARYKTTSEKQEKLSVPIPLNSKEMEKESSLLLASVVLCIFIVLFLLKRRSLRE